MERLEPTEHLLTGIAEIDSRYSEFFARGNAVLSPETEKTAAEDIISVLEFLIQYVDEQFSTEERVMEYYGYDHQDGHRKQHQRLQMKVEKLYLRANKADTDMDLASELYCLFSDWFTYHIKEWDLSYVNFVQKCIKLECLDDVDYSDVEVIEFNDFYTGRPASL